MAIEMSTVGTKLKQAFSTVDINTIVDLAPEPSDYKTYGIHVVTIAMAVMECIVKRRRNDWLNEALVCLMHVHTSLPDISDSWNKLYVDLLVDIKVKAVMHRLFSLDLDECDTLDMEAIAHSYFDPTLFSGVEEQSEKVEYTDKHSYSAIMHKMAYDGITGMIKSKENVTKMREVFKNDIGHFEERLKKLLRSYFQIARNHIPPQVKEEVVDDHQPGKDAPAISHHHTESNSLVMDSPEKSTEKTITEVESSFIGLWSPRSKRTSSMVARTKIQCTYDDLESDQVSSSNEDEPDSEFYFNLPEALLQSTASQQPSQHSNTQTCDQVGGEVSKTKTAPKFFYERSTQSQEMASQNIEPAKPVKRNQTARKRTYPLPRVTESTKVLKSKLTARKFTRPRGVSPVGEGYKEGMNLRQRQRQPVHTRTLRPRQIARKHTRRREVSPYDDLDEKSVSYRPAKRKRDRSPQLETAEKNSPVSKNKPESYECSSLENSPNQHTVSTQIVDVGGPEDVLYLSHLSDLSDVESSLSVEDLEDEPYLPGTTKQVSKHPQSGHSNVDKIAAPQTPSPRVTYVRPRPALQESAGSRSTRPRSPALQEPAGSRSTSSEEILKKSGVSNIFNALRDVMKKSKARAIKTGRNSNNNNAYYMSPEIPLLNSTSFLTSTSDKQSDSN